MNRTLVVALFALSLASCAGTTAGTMDEQVGTHSAALTTWSPVTTIATTDPGVWRTPTLAMDPDGTAVAIWTSGFQAQSQVMASRFDGSTWSAPVALSTPSSIESTPLVSVNAGGTAMANWTLRDP